MAPKDQNSVTTLVGPDATIFDTTTLTEITTDLTTKVATVGDTKAADEEGNNVVVWLSTTSTRSSDGVVRSRDIERSAFNATTAEAVNCCGEFVSTTEGMDVPVQREGLLVKFPFNAQKTTYDWWDGDLGEAVPIKYVATEEVAGVTTYKYSRPSPDQHRHARGSGLILGEPDEGNLDADVMYSNVRTLWAEPNTGVIINRVEEQNNTLDYDGTSRVTTTRVTSGYDDATIDANADDYGPKGSQLNLIRNVLPWVLLAVGLLALVGGILLFRRGSRTDAAAGRRFEATDTVKTA